MLVNVIEIHKASSDGEVDPNDFKIGGSYTGGIITEICRCQIQPEIGKGVVFLTIDIGDTDRMEFIKVLSSDLSNAYILISPTDEQDIIIDFTMDVNYYSALLEYTAIIPPERSQVVQKDIKEFEREFVIDFIRDVKESSDTKLIFLNCSDDDTANPIREYVDSVENVSIGDKSFKFYAGINEKGMLDNIIRSNIHEYKKCKFYINTYIESLKPEIAAAASIDSSTVFLVCQHNDESVENEK